MALLKTEIHSNVLNMDTHITVILPHDITKSKSPAKVLYFLHGLGGDSTKISRYTDLERLLHGKDIAVVFPEVQRSFYTDMRYGLNYFQYVAYELPKICKNLFNISDKREDNFVCGISMGGYGALKVGLSRPDFFSKIIAISAATNLKRDLDNPEGTYIEKWNLKHEFTAICGDDLKLTDNEDTWFLAEKAIQSGNSPDLLILCGTEDFLYQSNLKFKNHLENIGYSFEYFETKGYHSWDFWENNISKVVEYICR